MHTDGENPLLDAYERENPLLQGAPAAFRARAQGEDRYNSVQ
jgi:hypothetical protein